MTTINATINARYIAAASLWVSSDPTKDILTRVHILPNTINGGCYIEATNGHVAIRLYDKDAVVSEQFYFKVTKEFVQIAKKSINPNVEIDIQDVDNYNFSYVYTFQTKLGKQTVTLQESKHPTEQQYPRIAQLIPDDSKCSSDFFFMNTEYLGLINDTVKLLNTSKAKDEHIRAAKIQCTGKTSPVVAKIKDGYDFIATAILMPIQFKD